MLKGADGDDIRKIGEFINLDEFLNQLLTIELIDFRDDRNQRNLPCEAAVIAFLGELRAQPAENTFVTRTDFLVGGKQERDFVDIGEGFLNDIIEPLTEQSPRAVDTRRIDQHQLGVIGCDDAAYCFSGRFRP